MNNGQGLLAGATVAFALLMRGGPGQISKLATDGNVVRSSTGGGASTMPAQPRVGLWLASCSYWAAVRRAALKHKLWHTAMIICVLFLVLLESMPASANQGDIRTVQVPFSDSYNPLTVTWSPAFPDTNYSAVCTIETTPSDFLLPTITMRSPGSMQVSPSDGGAPGGILNCMAIPDSDSSDVRHGRVSYEGHPASVTVPWSTAFPDTNYTAVCTAETEVDFPSESFTGVISEISPTSVTMTNDGYAIGTINCIGVPDSDDTGFRSSRTAVTGMPRSVSVQWNNPFLTASYVAVCSDAQLGATASDSAIAIENGSLQSTSMTVIPELVAGTVECIAVPATIQIVPPSQLSVGAGLPYNGTFTATGGTGTGYTWYVLAGSLPGGFNLSSNGLISSNGTPAATPNTYSFTVQVTDSGGNTATQTLALTILCSIKNVELVPLGQSVEGLPTVLFAYFIPPTGQTLSDYATSCGFSNFDWVQNITLWPAPNGDPDDELFAKDNPTLPLSAPPMFSDPPFGGYTYQFTSNGQPTPALAGLPHFATAYPFYYSPLDLAGGCAIANASFHCNTNVETNPYTLNFFDGPLSPQCEYPSSCISIQTQLVGICDSTSISPSCHASGPSSPLYQWTWTSNVSCIVPDTYVCILSSGEVSTANSYLPPAGVESGGVNVASINGVPSPQVSVNPSASTILVVEPLSVGITVGQFQGAPVPAGTVTLSSGGYTSTAATLDGNGAADITIPAGSLSVGSDMLTVTFTPATPLSATYSQAWGTAAVTVNPVTPEIVFVPNPSSQTYGTPITAGSLDATAQYNSSPVSGTFVYTTGACSGGGQVLSAGATVLQAGSYAMTACFTPSEAGVAAASATAPYSVTPASQSISFGPIAAQLVGATIPLNATATSGLAVAFQSLTPPVCSVSQATMTMLSLGTCMIEATQSGGVDYNAASPVEVSFPVMGFTLTAEPASETVKRGALGVFLLKVKSVNGFAGEVSISCAGGPPESACRDFPQTVWVKANRTALALSSILFRPEDAEGTYTITFTGISATDKSTTKAQLRVE